MTGKAKDWRDRFVTKFKVGAPDECWEWLGHIGSRGYGQHRMDSVGYREPSHRAAYLFHCGEIPDGLWVLHSCDNKRCVNPNHLHLGTPADNSREAAERGLYPSGDAWRDIHLASIPRGESHAKSKLTEVQVIAIRKSSASCAVTGQQFGVSAKTVSRIRRKEVWAHLGA